MLECDITYEIENMEDFMEEERIEKFCNFILKREYGEEYEKNNYYLSFLITTDEVIREINREYREKDSATDVISFAYNETENMGPVNILGDIVISADRIRCQSEEYGHTSEREFYYVLCHGLLHLLGYDHIEEKERSIMRKKEEEILEEFNYTRN